MVSDGGAPEIVAQGTLISGKPQGFGGEDVLGASSAPGQWKRAHR